MIWTNEGLIHSDKVGLFAHDRALEAGIGLFETFRTWNRRLLLLDRHRQRMYSSAIAFNLTHWDDFAFPGEKDVSYLLEGLRIGGDARVRVTLSGGVTPRHETTPEGLLSRRNGSRIWMRAVSLDRDVPESGVAVGGRFQIAADDPLNRHKTLNYWRRTIVREKANEAGYFESLGTLPGAGIQEGSFTNVFLVIDGQLWTPGLGAAILPGIMRRFVIETAVESGIAVNSGSPGLTEEELTRAVESGGEMFLTNAVRGIVPVGTLDGRSMKAPGPTTKILSALVRSRLESGASRL